MDKEWTGTFTIAEVCGKGLYSLKNAHGKVLKKKYNSIQLKIYEERQGHAAASEEDIESKIELDGTNSHNEESASKERPDVTDSHNEKSVMGMKCLLMEYLMSSCFHHVCFDYGEQVQMNLHLKQQKMKTLM